MRKSLRSIASCASRVVARATPRASSTNASPRTLPRLTTRASAAAPRTALDARFCARGFASDASAPVSARTLSEALLEERAHESAAYEPSAAAASGPPEPFELHETDGDAEVTLTKTYGDDEEIAVTFVAQEEPYDDDMLDEDDFDEEEDGLDEELELEEDESIAIDFNVVVSKTDGSAHLDFDCVTDGEIIEIRHVSYEQYDENNPILGTAYSGPNFEDLEETVQDKFHDYLEVRGINSDLASYIVEAHLDKEQREYTNWLGNVSKFVADKKETE